MPLCSLPTEIVSLILDVLDEPNELDDTSKLDRLSLCLTNKQFAQLIQPRLFRHFSLRDPAKAVKCLLLVIARPDLALAARDVLIGIGFKDPAVLLPICFFKLLARGLTCMSNITSLHFSGSSMSDIVFRDVSLPQLKKFSSIIYVTPDVSKFLNRHPTITQLFIGGEMSACILDVNQEFLPSLNCFMGSLWVAEKVIPGRPVKDITLVWITFVEEERTMNIIGSFSLSSIPIEQFFCTTLHIKENRISLLMAIAKYLPHLRLLHLNNFSLAGFLDRIFIDTLISLLPCFKHLERLIVPSFNKLPFTAYDRSLQLQEDKLTVEWKKICPELIRIIFPSRNIYDYDASSKVWKRADTPFTQTISIFSGVH